MACKNHPDRESVAACVTCGTELCAECDELGADGKSYCSADLPAASPAPPPVAPAPAPVPPPAAAPQPVAAPPPPAVVGPSSNIVLAALGYPIWICALITVLIEKNDPEVKYHGWNGMFWGLSYFVVSMALRIVMKILQHVPGMGAVMGLVAVALPLAFLVLSIIFAVNAYNRKPVNIPVISDLARKQVGA